MPPGMKVKQRIGLGGRNLGQLDLEIQRASGI